MEEKTDKNNSKYLSLIGTKKKIYYFGGDNVSVTSRYEGRPTQDGTLTRLTTTTKIQSLSVLTVL